MKVIKLLVESAIAGLCIGLGGAIYLSCISGLGADLFIAKVIGAFLFATGLFTICTYGWGLYTGKIGYLIGNKPSFLADLGVILIGNFIGTFIFAYMILGTRMASPLVEISKTIVDAKLNDSWYSLLLLSIPCGFLMYFAVNTFKKLENHAVARYISIFLGVVIFILCGFEHIIANLFYITLAGKWGINCIIPLLMMTLGNSLGAFIVPLYDKFKNWGVKQ